MAGHVIHGRSRPWRQIAAPARYDRKTGKGVKELAVKEIGIIINGATGRIASTQHLANALAPIRAGRARGSMMAPIALYRACFWSGAMPGDSPKSRAPMRSNVGRPILMEALAQSGFPVFFDGAATKQRVSALTRAISAGKHIYTEKPVAPSVAEGLSLLEAARSRGLKHGAVEHKIFLPGLKKLTTLTKQGFFGRITGFALEFGWWVFDGTERPA